MGEVVARGLERAGGRLDDRSMSEGCWAVWMRCCVCVHTQETALSKLRVLQGVPGNDVQLLELLQCCACQIPTVVLGPTDAVLGVVGVAARSLHVCLNLRPATALQG